jgi:predicted nucleic acid-binding protein
VVGVGAGAGPISHLERLATCLPFLLEAGYSARTGQEYRLNMGRLEQLPRVLIDQEVEKAAQKAQRQLAKSGHHRLSPTDLIIAVCAAEVHGGVLHYDRDYDLILEHTSLDFESIWLVDPGSL